MDVGEASVPLDGSEVTLAQAQEDSCLLLSGCNHGHSHSADATSAHPGNASSLQSQQHPSVISYPSDTANVYGPPTQQALQQDTNTHHRSRLPNYGGCHHDEHRRRNSLVNSPISSESAESSSISAYDSNTSSKIPQLVHSTSYSGSRSIYGHCTASTSTTLDSAVEEVQSTFNLSYFVSTIWNRCYNNLLPSRRPSASASAYPPITTTPTSTTASSSTRDHQQTTKTGDYRLLSRKSLLREIIFLTLLCGSLLLACGMISTSPYFASISTKTSSTIKATSELFAHPGDTSFWQDEIWNMFWGSEAQEEADDDSVRTTTTKSTSSSIGGSSSTYDSSQPEQVPNHAASKEGNNETPNQPNLRQDQMPSSKSYQSTSRRSSIGSSNAYKNNNKHMEPSSSDPKLVIAGKMMVGDGTCNIGELNLRTGDWSMKERVQLSLYNSYSGGEVYYLLANHTFAAKEAMNGGSGSSGGGVFMGGDGSYMRDDTGMETRHKRDKDEEKHRGRELIVVGAFDTTDQNSQVTYCSVGAWDGTMLSKVGEGLCNSALSKGMKITTAALAGPQDVYVAGSFVTQVWNGDRHEFVKIYNIAHYDALKQVWLPLPIGQITCSWCTVTVLALAWDSTRNQLHIAGKFNAIDGRNIPSGLAIYDHNTGHLVAHPGGGLTMWNRTQDGVGTALQLDEKAGVLYVMGAFERLGTGQVCFGLAAYEINENHWTCLADMSHTVRPSGGGNMLLTSYGLMVAGRITSRSTWPDHSRPYTIALLNATLKTESGEKKGKSGGKDGATESSTETKHDFKWSWLPGFEGHDEPLHALANGFGEHEGSVFIAGDNLVAKWYLEKKTEVVKQSNGNKKSGNEPLTRTIYVPVTENLSTDRVRGAIMAIAQLEPDRPAPSPSRTVIGYKLGVYLISLGALLGMFVALLCNRSLNQAIFAFLFNKEAAMKGISLDMLTYSAGKGTMNVHEAYTNAMKNRSISASIPHLLQPIDPQQIILHRIIGEGTFGRVWSAKLNSASVAVKEFVFAQAAVAGKSAQQNEIIEEIIGEAGMMAILRHPNVLQLFGCSLTAQAIWIVSELCSLGSLRQLLDDKERELSLEIRARIALQVAEGMMYLHNQDPPIIHRDLKSHNILIHETFTEASGEERSQRSIHEISHNGSSPFRAEATIIAKIGDWGSARATLSGSKTMTHGVGTACWLAPEVIKHARSSKFSDVYGYGIILWELATREEVYSGLESTQIIAKVANDGLRPPIPDSCPWTPLMVKCWSEKPDDRADFAEIVKTLNKIIEDLSTTETKDSNPSNGDSSSNAFDSENKTHSYQHQIVTVS